MSRFRKQPAEYSRNTAAWWGEETERRCRRCRRWKPIAEFPRVGGGQRYECATCWQRTKTQQRNRPYRYGEPVMRGNAPTTLPPSTSPDAPWGARNREAAALHARKRRERKWATQDPARPVDRAAIYQRDCGRCHICGEPVSADAFDLDHLVPLSAGGADVPENVAVAHPACNGRRGRGRLPAQLRLPT